MKDIWAEDVEKKVNVKNVIIVCVSAIIIITTIALVFTYILNAEFRNWVDFNILFKVVEQGNTVSIEVTDENMQAFAYDKYILVLQRKILKFYNNLGTEVKSLSLEVNDAIYDVCGKYIAIAEKNGKNLYVIAGKQIIWEAKSEEKILQIEINENGYVAIVTSDVSYKNIISIYNNEGKEILKTYLASTKVVDISVSKDNQYLAIAEVDMSGVLIKSDIRIISIQEAKSDPSNAIIYTHNSELNKLIINIEYQTKNRLVCMYNDSIDYIENQENKQLVNLNERITSFITIELNNNISIVEEKASGNYTSDSYVSIINVGNKKQKQYKVEKVAKKIYSFENVIGLNFGTELYIINKNGWLLKKYVANQEINNVVMSNKIVGIIYRNKIEIIDI